MNIDAIIYGTILVLLIVSGVREYLRYQKEQLRKLSTLRKLTFELRKTKLGHIANLID